MTTLVTGGGSGLAAEPCRQAASRGARVIVWDLDGEAAAQTVALITAAGGAACHHQVDVTDAAAVAAAAAGAGPVDVLRIAQESSPASRCWRPPKPRSAARST